MVLKGGRGCDFQIFEGKQNIIIIISAHYSDKKLACESHGIPDRPNYHCSMS